MNKEKRLTIYNKALVDYKLCLKYPKETINLAAEYGFCTYFQLSFNIHLSGDSFKKKFPELYAQRKTHEESTYHYLYNGDCKEGLKLRISALKKAIKILEKKLNYV